ncbi:uncharacterized protein LOC130644361 [Hydractinia symbiolongicarpus]|uniref:uncharacterized protein LOC130644361 n=1 Tax=Hydractinia symbiolongicarpus TaxID=13093 RepID=UPI002549D836|nr:uncharacterized protein LOC130644361 [Hydractinia symbiolongicarpus]
MVVSLKAQFLAQQIFRQNTWSYDRRNTSPFKVEACIIANTKIDQGALKRNIYSANLLERKKLISGGKYQQRTTKKNDIDKENTPSNIFVVEKKASQELKKLETNDGISDTTNDAKKNKLRKATGCSSERPIKLPIVNSSNHNITRLCTTSSFNKAKNIQNKSTEVSPNKLDVVVKAPCTKTQWKNTLFYAHTKSFSGRKETFLPKKHNRKLKNLISVSPIKKSKKKFYSEKQSGNINGIPCVPPCSPDTYNFEFVACLADVKSQRSFKKRLQKLGNRQSEKERILLKKTLQIDRERKLKEREDLVKKQRQLIYALNKVMTDLENKNFVKFKEKQTGAPV